MTTADVHHRARKSGSRYYISLIIWFRIWCTFRTFVEILFGAVGLRTFRPGIEAAAGGVMA
jgi:hypothetical protein